MTASDRGDQQAITALPTLDTRLLANTSGPLVSAGRCITRLARRLALPADRIDIRTTSKQPAKASHLFARGEPRYFRLRSKRWWLLEHAPFDPIRFQQRHQALVLRLQNGQGISLRHGSFVRRRFHRICHYGRFPSRGISRPGYRFVRNSSITASASFHPSPPIRAIKLVQTRSNARIESSSFQRTPVDNIGATSSVRLRVSFSSMRCSAIARVIGFPSSAR